MANGRRRQLGGRAEAACGPHPAKLLRSGRTLLLVLDPFVSHHGRGCAHERRLNIACKVAVGFCKPASEIVWGTQCSNGRRDKQGREGDGSEIHG